MYDQYGETPPLDKRATGDMNKDKSSRDNSRLVQDNSQLLPAIGRNQEDQKNE
jgi:hypothetical protein